jgi:hypothetical protein
MPYKQPPVEHQIKEGEVRNPDGRPKGSFSLLRLLREELEKCPDGQDKKTYADLIVKRMLKESIEKGDIQHIKTIWSYIEGQPKETHDVGGEILIKIAKEIADKHETNTSTIQDSNG